MEALAANQSSLGKSLKAIADAYYHLSEERKTLRLVSERLEKIDDIWAVFDETDSEIRNKFADEKSHLYFTEDFYDQTKSTYEQLRVTLLTKQQQLIQAAKETAQQQQEQLNSPHQMRNNEGPSNKPGGSEPPINNKYMQKAEQTETDRSQVVTSAMLQVSRRLRHQTELLSTLLCSISFEGSSKEYLELKQERIATLWKAVEELQQELVAMTDTPADLGVDTNQFHQLDAEVETMLIRLRTQLSTISGTIAVNTNTSPLVRLPQITIPQFNGDYLRWSQFRDLFNQLVHRQASLGDVQKMWYLKTNLSGEAERLIRHLTLSDTNYTVAWSILTERYHNKRLQVTAALDKLYNIQPIQAESASQIKSLHDTVKECILVLENMDLPVTGHWDPILLHTLLKKLDKETLTLYEQSLKAPRELQSLQEFLQFLELRFQSMEAIGTKSSGTKPRVKSTSSLIANDSNIRCAVCKGEHPLYRCSKFLNMDTKTRTITVQRNQLCRNCLRKGHLAIQCPSSVCRRCSKKHNTLLHEEDGARGQFQHSTHATDDAKSQPVSCNVADDNQVGERYVFLGTAMVDVLDHNNKRIQCRALLDTGAQSCFISERLIRRLKLNTTQANTIIEGIGNNQVASRDQAAITVMSRVTAYKAVINALVINNITSQQPHRHIDISSWEIPSDLSLADPTFNEPQRIDLLLGCELYGELLREGHQQIGRDLPFLQNTTLGWVVLGKSTVSTTTANVAIITTQQLDEHLQRFWQLDDVKPAKPLTEVEEKCEQFFQNTVDRNSDGTFTVNLPILGNTNVLGESMEIALRRFLNLEKKLSKTPDLLRQYNDCLEDYIDRGHMKEIRFSDIPAIHYFLPHHFVLKPTSSTTKMRPVFDASAKTTSNVSLNDLQLTGYRVQDELFDILLRFRTYRYVMTCDIHQMYRQIWLADEDRKYQLIIWRRHPGDKIRYFQLNTVTFGMRASPFLAVRTIKELIKREGAAYPLAAAALKNLFMDDELAGSNFLAVALKMQRELIQLLNSGGFKLHKWSANHPELLKNIPESEREEIKVVSDRDDGYIKTLGLTWHPNSDQFVVTCQPSKFLDKITKRTVLSEAACLFDPLGLVNPVVAMAKIFIQKLWKLKLDWDTELPENMRSEWLEFRHGLTCLDRLKIPRYVFTSSMTMRVELHGFGDASEKAYGTAIYIRAIHANGKITCNLLCARSRVAPVKTITLPRLELCAAHLTAELMHHVQPILDLNVDEVYYWSDSQIVLSWLRSDPATLKTFIANRVAAVLEHTTPTQWNYVSSPENPADLVSRGCTAEVLISYRIWLTGPEFLALPEPSWPTRSTSTIRLQEEEKTTVSMVVAFNNQSQHPVLSINHRNSFSFLQRVTARVLKAVKRFKGLKNESSESITTIELHDSLLTIAKAVQQTHFTDELAQLRANGTVKPSNRLSSLAPFVDKDGILRVGGRLDAASISYSTRHPILIPSADIANLILSHLHVQNLHPGPQALLAISRQQFWIIQGRALARSVVSHCVQCARAKPKLGNQLMGSLPKDRVLPARPFIKTGVDFCGPIWTHYHIRGKRPQKSYIAVFCCFTTKAIHLEVVSDLTTEGFIGALKRFMARRGRCTDIFCDNATNFVGTRNQLQELQAMVESKESQSTMERVCSDKGVQMHFIPPRSPHFGGLWEAAVRSVKKLLRSSLTSASLTFEELCTVTAEAEAILNSRPLTPLSSDPNDFAALTPGHFLIGEPLTSIPNPTSSTVNFTALSRWKLVTYMQQELWKRWTSEYLTELQKRYKWKQPKSNLQPGMLVILKEDSPPLKWPMARIVEIIKGSDGHVRVVKVRNSKGEFTRAVHNVALLPIEVDDPVQSEPSAPSEQKEETAKRPSEDNQPPRRTKTRKGTMSTLLLSALTCVLWLGSATAAVTPSVVPYKISTLPTSSGLYFENIGQGHLIEDECKLIMYHNMTSYWNTMSVIEGGVQNLHSLNKLLKDQSYSNPTISQYDHQLLELQQGNNFLAQGKIQQTRTKRGLFNFVGNVANKFFGVLDDEYASHVGRVIDKVHNNEEYLLDLIKNQTIVIEATSNLAKKALDNRIEQFNRLKARVDESLSQTRNLSEIIHQERLMQSFLALSLYLTSLFVDIQRLQSTIIDIVTDAHHGRMNAYLLPPEQLEQQLRMLQLHLDKRLRIPYQGHLYNLMTVKCKITRDRTIFVVTLPLVSSSTYVLFKLIPFPIYFHGKFVRIESRIDFLLTDKYYEQAYAMTTDDFTHCLNFDTSEYLCWMSNPTYSKTAHQTSCELGLLAQHKIDNQCLLQFSPPEKTWVQLHQANTWLFALGREYAYHMTCEDFSTLIRLNGSGILSLSGDCLLKDDDITIRSFRSYESTLTEVIYPDVSLPAALNYTLPPTLISKEPTAGQLDFTEDFGHLKTTIQQLKIRESRGLTSTNIGGSYHYIGGYAVLTLVIIFGIFLVWKYGFRQRVPRLIETADTTAPSLGNLTRDDFHIDGQPINVGEDVQAHQNNMLNLQR